MNSDCEQYQKRQDYKKILARRIFYWSVFCILLGMITIKAIALIPESEPKKEYSVTSEIPSDDRVLHYDSTEGALYWSTDSDSLKVLSGTGTWANVGEITANLSARSDLRRKP